jgi:signal transduction histidine kinase
MEYLMCDVAKKKCAPFQIFAQTTFQMKKNGLLFLLFSLATQLYAQPVRVSEGWSSQIVEPNLSVLPERNGQVFDENEIADGRYDHIFAPFDESYIRGTASVNWFRLKVENASAESQKLYLGTNRFDYLDLWGKIDTALIWHQRSGQLLSDEEKSVGITGFSFFVFELPAGKTATFYLKAENKSAFTSPKQYIPLTLMSERQYADLYEKPTSYTFMFIGAIVMMWVFNLILFFITRAVAYFYYTIYVVLIGLFTLALIPQFAIPLYGHDDLNRIPLVWIGIFAVIAYTLVGREILETRKYFPRTDKMLRVILVAYAVSFALTLFPGTMPVTVAINFTSAIVSYSALYVLAAIMLYRRHLPGTYFFIGYSVYFGSQLIFLPQLLGLLPSVWYGLTPSAVFQIGVTTEVALFSLALGARIQEMRKKIAEEALEKERILREQEEERKRVLEEQNVMLEEKVKQRTAQIEEQKEVLEKSLAELKLAQSKLVESEKMASLGQLTAGVAHEINNPINFVSVGVKNLVRNFEDAKEIFENYLNPNASPEEAARQLADEKSRQQVFDLFDDAEMLFKSIQNGVDRTISIVKSLRNFSRLDEGEFKMTDLHEGLDSTLEILHSQIKKKAEVVKKYGQLPFVECAAGKLNQVFLNIINNALQAMDKPGTLTLETQYLKEKNEVAIIISDTGKGMSEEVKRRLFEPFFTTKPVGEGTGLGLSISYGIIEEHKGRIEVESPARPSHADGELGKGSTFRITLPVSQR